MSTPSYYAQEKRRRVFFAFSCCWLLLAYVVSAYIADIPFWWVVFGTLLFATPIAISGAYSSAVNQTKMLTLFNSSGLAHQLLSGRLTRSIAWIVWALVSSFAMLIHFAGYSALNWFVLALSIPTFWFIHKASIRFLTKEINKPYVIENMGIIWTRWLCTLLMTAVYGCILWLFSEAPEVTSLAEELAQSQQLNQQYTGSSVVQLALGWASFIDGTTTYLGRSLSAFGEHIPWVLSTFTGFVVFFNTSVTFGTFVIPASEYRRVLGPVSDQAPPAPLSNMRVAASAAVITVVCVFIYVPLFAQVEAYVRSSSALLESVQNARRMVEKIDNDFYAPGTLKALELAKLDALRKMDLPAAVLNERIDSSFALMESKVDRYLDWYYSLSGEYARIAKLMTGEIETFMQEKLVEELAQEQSLQPVFAAMASLSTTYKAAGEEYQKAAKKILDANRLEVPALGAMDVPSLELSHVLLLPMHIDTIAIEQRIAGGAAAAGVGAAVVAKTAGKGAFKLAGKALSKAAMSKVAATGAGAAVGATVGTFLFPGAGTAAGGALGGLIAGAAADKVLLKLEEIYGREDFRKEIIDSLHQARDSFKRDLQGHIKLK